MLNSKNLKEGAVAAALVSVGVAAYPFVKHGAETIYEDVTSGFKAIGRGFKKLFSKKDKKEGKNNKKAS